MRSPSLARRIVLSVLLCGTVAGCGSDPFSVEGVDQVSGLLNGDAWSAPAYSRIKSGVVTTNPDTLFLEVYDSRVWLNIRLAVNGPGRYALAGNQIDFQTLSQGEQVTGRYVGSASVPGELVISRLDGLNGIDATLEFTADHQNGEKRYGNTVRVGALFTTTSSRTRR